MPVGIYDRTNSKMNKGIFKKGHRQSEEIIKKMSDSHKGKTPWNKGKTGIYSEGSLEKMRLANKGKNLLKKQKEE